MSCMLPASGGCCLCGPEAGRSFLAADHSPSPSEEGRPGGPLRASSSTHCPAPGGFTSGSDLHNTHPVWRPANHRASSMSCQSVMLWSWTFHTFVPLYWWRPPWVRLQRNLKIKKSHRSESMTINGLPRAGWHHNQICEDRPTEQDHTKYLILYI